MIKKKRRQETSMLILREIVEGKEFTVIKLFHSSTTCIFCIPQTMCMLCVCYGWLQVLKYLQVTAMINQDNVINVCLTLSEALIIIN